MVDNIVKNAIASLETTFGQVTPASVVSAAEDDTHDLHAYFTWDDSKAGRLYRLQEARELIRSVRIEITYKEVQLRAPLYVRDPDANASESRYRNIMQIKNEEDSARAVIIREQQAIISAVARAKQVAAVLGLDDEIDKIRRLAVGLTATPDASASASA